MALQELGNYPMEDWWFMRHNLAGPVSMNSASCGLFWEVRSFGWVRNTHGKRQQFFETSRSIAAKLARGSNGSSSAVTRLRDSLGGIQAAQHAFRNPESSTR